MPSPRWSAAGEDGKLLAGGQSLLPVLRLRLAAPTTVVDLGGVAALRGIRVDGDDLVVGAMTTHAEVAASGLVRAEAPLVAADRGDGRGPPGPPPRHARRLARPRRPGR